MSDVGLSNPVGLRIAQAFSLGVAGWLTGALGSISIFAVPVLLTTPPTVCARSFRVLNNIETLTIPTTTAFATLGCIYSCRRLYQLDRQSKGYESSKDFKSKGIAQWKLFAATATFLSSIPLTTFLLMKPTSDALLLLAKEVSSTIGGPAEGAEGGLQTTGALILRWGLLNLVRTGFAFVGAATGLYACFR